MKFVDVKDLSEKELKTKMSELRFNMFESRMKNTLGQLSNPLSIRAMRRDVARIRTALRNKQAKAEVK